MKPYNRYTNSDNMPDYESHAMRRWKILTYIFICVAVTPILLFRDFTPSNELRYLSIVDEALQNMTFWSFTNHGLPYADKPPLYFWCLMLCRQIAGNHYMILLGLFSLIPGLITANVMDCWCRKELDIRNRKMSMLVLLTSAFFIGMMVVLRMDMLMTMFITLSLRTFHSLYKHYNSQAERDIHFNRLRWFFGIYLFLALFSKGPLGILIPLCATSVFMVIKGKTRQFFHYWGWRTWTLLIGLCAIWFGSVYLEGGQQYLDNLLFHQTIDRAVNSFHHDRPFWYYIVAIWYIIAPWSLMVIGLICASLRNWKECSVLQQFMLTVSVTTFVLLSCISAKLQVYMLPAVPFLVYGAMMSVRKYRHSVWMRVAIGIPAAVYVLAMPAYYIAIFGLHFEMADCGWFEAASWMLTIVGIISIILLCRGEKNQRIRRVISPMAYGLLSALFLAGWGMSSVNDYTGYGNICHKVLDIQAKTGYDKIYTWRISRPENMDVYLHQDIIEIPKDSVAEIAGLRGAMLILPAKCYNELPPISHDEVATVGKNIILTIPK